MRIAFVSVNRESMPDAVIPLGVLYVLGNTPREHETTLIDLCFASEPLETLAAKLKAFNPDLVAIGIRNIQNNTYTDTSHNLAYYRACMETVRATTKAPVVLGGGGFSVMPAAMLEDLGADFGVAGEGERTFAGLVEALVSDTLENVRNELPGLLWRAADRVVENPIVTAFQSLDAIAPPPRELLDPRYFQDYGIDSVQTKRGCPLRCTYCTYPLIEGRSIRQRAPSAVVDELFASLEANPGLEHVFIVDSVFNLPPPHARAVCEEMIRRAWPVPWTAYANPIGFDEPLAAIMREAGCAGVEIGSDSGCDEVLTALQKGFSTSQIRATHDACRRAGLPDCHTFILGTTGETLDDVRRTLDFAIDLDPFAAILMIWTDDTEALDPGLARTRRGLRDAIRELLTEAQNRFPRWIIPPLGTNFDARLFRFLRKRGMRGPLWQYIQKVDDRPRSRARPG